MQDRPLLESECKMTSDQTLGDRHANSLVFARENIEQWLWKRLERTERKKLNNGSLVWNQTLVQIKGRV